MPMKAYQASTSYAGNNISSNLGLWIVISAALTALFSFLYWKNPEFQAWAHLLTLAGCFCGILVMLQSQVGYVSSTALAESEEEVAITPIPRA